MVGRWFWNGEPRGAHGGIVPVRVGGRTMRSTARIAGLSLVGAAFGAACGGDGGDVSGTTGLARSTLSAPGTIPFPASEDYGWSLSDLIAADAWSQCSFVPGSTTPVSYMLAGDGDRYLARLSAAMEKSMMSWRSANRADADTRTAWLVFRADSKANVDGSGKASAISLRTMLLNAAAIASSEANLAGAQQQARDAVASASMNLCTAMLMRQSALRGDLLLMPEAEQQKLAETVRERVQMALLQYAGMLRLTAAATGSLTDNAGKYQIAAYIKSAVNADPSLVDSWLSDMGTALQLHIAVTTELGEMFLRSASAKTPRGGNATSAADEEWGAGSWRQRFLALLYGGDALAGDTRGAVPWETLLESQPDDPQKPGVVLNSTLASVANNDWPSDKEIPYVRTDAVDSRVALFRDIANASNVIPRVGADWFSNVDQAVQARCAQPLAKCGTIETTYRVTSDHAAVARKILEESTGLSQIDGIGPYYVSAGLTLSGDSVQVSGGLTLVQRPLLEYAANFARMTPYPWPTTLDVRVERTHAETPSSAPSATRTSGSGGAGLPVPIGGIIGALPLSIRVGDDLGMPAGGVFSDAMRVLGTVPALVLVREAVKDFQKANPVVGPKAGTSMSAILATIQAAIGSQSTLVRAMDATQAINWSAYGLAINRKTYERIQPSYPSSDGQTYYLGWQIDADIADAASLNTSAMQVIAVPDEPRLYPLLLRPSASQYGKTAASVLNTASGGKAIQAQSVAVDAQKGRLTAKVFLPLNKLDSKWSFVLRQGSSSFTYVPLVLGAQLRTMPMNQAISPSLPVGLFVPLEGQYFATGGFFGQIARRALARRADNPARSLYDGFGLPSIWVPSVDSTAYGSAPGDTPVDYFLRNAKQAAQDATDAVKTAFDGLLAVQKDSADLQAAQARSAFVASAEQQGLCGTAVPCDTTVTTALVLNVPKSPTRSECEALATQVVPLAPVTNETDTTRNSRYSTASDVICKKFDCMRLDSERAYAQLSMSTPVKNHLSDSSQPTFDEYAGGSLQKSFIEQWAAVRELRQAADALSMQIKAAQAKVDAAIASVKASDAQIDACMKEKVAGEHADEAAKREWVSAQQAEQQTCLAMTATPWDIKCPPCGLDGVDEDDWDRFSDFGGFGEDFEVNGALWQCKAKPEVWQAYFGARAACFAAKKATEAAKDRADAAGYRLDVDNANCKVFDATQNASIARVTADIADAMAGIVNQRSELAKSGEKLALTIADQKSLMNQAALATAKQQLEAVLTANGQQTSFLLWREIHQYDTWRARALLDGARRYAVAARRAIEARYLVDLSTMRNNEPFVAAPYLWADGIYRYDLSLPAAVGLSLSPTGGGPVADVNQVLDYVGNLEKFVAGFAVARPASAALRDGEVIWLPGPKSLREQVQEHPGVSWEVNCESDYANTSCSDAPAGTQSAWCAPPTWATLDTFCRAQTASGKDVLIAPKRARAVFQLDPWGRLDASIPTDPYQNRVNARWDRLVVNLVGAGVRDCSAAADPQQCWSEPFLRYALKQRGPVTAVSYDGRRTLLDIPTASIEGGKALAANELLDPVLNGWGKPYVEAVARTEFQERPLGGTYELEIETGPGVSLDNIERVQILLTSNYWVLQQR